MHKGGLAGGKDRLYTLADCLNLLMRGVGLTKLLVDLVDLVKESVLGLPEVCNDLHLI